MKIFNAAVFTIALFLMLTTSFAGASYAKTTLAEKEGVAAGIPLRIRIPLMAGIDDKAAKSALVKAFEDASLIRKGDVTPGSLIDREVAVLKTSGIANAFVNAADGMYCLGQMGGNELWKAWIPHPTDKKKVFAFLRLQDKAVVTVRDKVSSASVVADDAAGAEKIAFDLLKQGTSGLEAAEDMGVDALIILNDGKKLKLGMAGGFKEQYGNAKA